MNKNPLKPIAFCAILVPLFFNAQQKKTAGTVNVSVTNDLSFKRKEVVSIPASGLKHFSQPSLRIKNKETGEIMRTQWMDYDKNGKADEFLFQAEVPAKSTTRYVLFADAATKEPQSQKIAYSRFVPERSDDYTWENDKVAFRTYGPKGQKEALEGVNGSTISSGVDLWFKRTEKSIINEWYAGHVKTPFYYHTDHGEGYDAYHVGNSRGTGGTGIWKNDSLYISQNYVKYNTIAAGPLRTVFELSYAPYGPYKTSEVKRITLDLGSNFSRFDIRLKSEKPLKNYTVGVTMHDKKGEYKINEKAGWISYWEKIDGTDTGSGVVMDPADVSSAFANISEVKDQSNVLLVTNAKNQISYYAGFAWEKSGQISNIQDWEQMLNRQAEKIKHPLKVKFE
ncbi:DUF4861 family protein [Chryseobacterium hagamense]|uniref:DUF4861 domain-containing protein n=1 Tax=Chryseobacterium hagamense TaxID=395935 RepID=A0A511YPV5_9FLAO|nr:DUF4861 family protein [Chryseobacterium hagamense]GEN77231.1 hypothetical protein CHA01nite_29710 [Chryseobacterium hagamense]